MWMACHSQQEIAEAVGYAKGPVSEFLDSLQKFGNGAGAEMQQSSEKPELDNRAFKVSLFGEERGENSAYWTCI